MLRFSTPKIVGTLAVVLIGLLLAVPSLLTREQRAPKDLRHLVKWPLQFRRQPRNDAKCHGVIKISNVESNFVLMPDR